MFQFIMELVAALIAKEEATFVASMLASGYDLTAILAGTPPANGSASAFFQAVLKAIKACV